MHQIYTQESTSNQTLNVKEKTIASILNYSKSVNVFQSEVLEENILLKLN